MAGSYLLDTDIAIEVLRGDRELWERIRAKPEIYLSVVVLGELYYGARGSGRPVKNAERVDELKGRVTVLGCDEETARVYGELKARLKVRGRMIPSNDLWIAASALQHDLVLVSRDAHYDAVEGLGRDSL